MSAQTVDRRVGRVERVPPFSRGLWWDSLHSAHPTVLSPTLRYPDRRHGAGPMTMNFDSYGASASGNRMLSFSAVAPASGAMLPEFASQTCTWPLPATVAVGDWAWADSLKKK